MIPRTGGRKARSANVGQMNGEELAEVHAAGLFLYRGEDISIKMDDLFDEPLAVNIAQLRERCERLPAVHYADRERVGIGLRRGREGKRQERVLVSLFKNMIGRVNSRLLPSVSHPIFFPVGPNQISPSRK